ncbi:hypothetical protein BDZ94DRAFT_1233258 [Collybia nuda]|uniref:Uncharacterized protein n=1 Tax=Collybia nuda TaxID=64659 RepID=A0A9P5YFU4_9AGAR|nr:hypothetical protein BDZ94DRAFT_1233258 [Collybia nuda]
MSIGGSFIKQRKRKNSFWRVQIFPFTNLIRTQSPVATTVDTEKPVPNVPACVQQVANIQKSIETLLNKQPACIYLDTLRHKYMLVLNDASIREAVTKMLHYQDTVHRYQDVLLQLVGPQLEEWKKADTVRQSVRQLVQGLEDLETYTMLGRSEMQENYQSQNLMYQSW